MLDHNAWSSEFASVVSCSKCTTQTCKNLLRDDNENVPQPGFIGRSYDQKRVLLAGQNPAITKSAKALAADMPYTAALRQIRDKPTKSNLVSLLALTRDFMPSWRVHQDYFPLRECGLSLDELAYLNVVRCRTARLNQQTNKSEDTPPNRRVAEACVASHFARWVDLLNPRVIVFLGKYAWDYGHAVAEARNIPADYLDRERSRPGHLRNADRARVAALVRENASQQPASTARTARLSALVRYGVHR